MSAAINDLRWFPSVYFSLFAHLSFFLHFPDIPFQFFCLLFDMMP